MTFILFDFLAFLCCLKVLAHHAQKQSRQNVTVEEMDHQLEDAVIRIGPVDLYVGKCLHVGIITVRTHATQVMIIVFL